MAEDPEAAPETGLRVIAVNVTNGSVDVSGLTASDRVKIRMTNGGITARDIRGMLDASTKNGEIKTERITGGAELGIFNGSIQASEVAGDVVVSAANGGITLERITGNVEADTKNGAVEIAEVTGSVIADTLNGRIEVASAVVGGSWNVGSAVGEIVIRIPEDADADISGAVTFGGIETDLPLELGKKTVRGRLGEGTHRIAIDANSSIAVKRYLPFSNSWN